MRTLVFRVPDSETEALVALGEDGYATLAFRHGNGSWLPPIAASTDTDTRCDCVCHTNDWDVGPRSCTHCQTAVAVDYVRRVLT